MDQRVQLDSRASRATVKGVSSEGAIKLDSGVSQACLQQRLFTVYSERLVGVSQAKLTIQRWPP